MSAGVSIVPVFVPHLGCKHDCVFCNQRRIAGQTTPASPALVRETLERAKTIPAGENGRELAFYGGSFTAIEQQERRALLSAAQPYLKDGTIRSLRVSTRPDAINEAVLAELKSFGAATVELGAQSMDARVLAASGRGHTAQDTENAARAVRRSGLSLVLQMMTGLPESTDESDLDTAHRLAALRPDAVRIYPTVIIRDTRLYTLWREGKYREHTVSDAVRRCKQIVAVFERAHIRILRLGLNPTQELSGGAAAAGAYHPAFGELVRSAIWYDRAEALLRGIPAGSRVVLGVHPSELSQVTGQHKCNLRRLKEALRLDAVTVRPTECARGTLSLLHSVPTDNRENSICI